MQSSHLAHTDVKLKAVKEDDEDVLFDERSLSRHDSNASECTVETMASGTTSIGLEEESHFHQTPNDNNKFISSFNNDSSADRIIFDVENAFKLDFDLKDSITNVEQTDL